MWCFIHFFLILLVLWLDNLCSTRRKSHILNYGFLCYKAASSLRSTRQCSQEWWHRDVNGFTETDFIQDFRMSRVTFNYICQCFSSRLTVQATHLLTGCVCMCDVEVAWIPIWPFRPVSDLGPHMKVSQIGTEKIRFHAICAVQKTYMTSQPVFITTETFKIKTKT